MHRFSFPLSDSGLLLLLRRVWRLPPQKTAWVSGASPCGKPGVETTGRADSKLVALLTLHDKLGPPVERLE